LPTITSLPLEEQLILKLEGGVRGVEPLKGLPGGISCQHAFPVQEHVPHTAAKHGAKHAFREKHGAKHMFRLREKVTILQEWQGHCRCRRSPMERFEYSDMEDVVDPCVRRKLEAIHDSANPFEHLEWSGEART
jgi:hypothetical protein